MPNFSGKKVDEGVPVIIGKDRYTEGDVAAAAEGGVVLGEKPGNVLFPIQIDANGYLKTMISGTLVPGTEYADGASNVGSSGTLVLGDDGANLQNVMVDAQGRLQVEVVEGEYDGVQYQDGAVNTSSQGTLILGDDGANVQNILVDAQGRLQVDIISGGSGGVQYQDGEAIASPYGTVALGHDGSNVFPVTVDSSGYLQIHIVSEPKAGVLNSGTDVSLVATSTTQIVGALSTRLCVLINNKKTNTQTFRIGDSNTGATRGVELAPGANISIETTEAVYGYNPGGSAESVTVIWTED